MIIRLSTFFLSSILLQCFSVTVQQLQICISVRFIYRCIYVSIILMEVTLSSMISSLADVFFSLDNSDKYNLVFLLPTRLYFSKYVKLVLPLLVLEETRIHSKRWNMMCIALVFTLTHALAGEFVLVVIRIDKWHYWVTEVTLLWQNM